jgi:hypothetical protein
VKYKGEATLNYQLINANKDEGQEGKTGLFFLGVGTGGRGKNVTK